jgi:hypothetical protein
MFWGGTRGQKAWGRLGWTLIALLASGLLPCGCAQNATGSQRQIPPLVTGLQAGDGYLSALPTAEAGLPVPSASPSRVEMLPSQLVVLHTNDNWGETEPCG